MTNTEDRTEGSMRWLNVRPVVGLLAIVVGAFPLEASSQEEPIDTTPSAWTHYGGDAGGQRFADVSGLGPKDVGELRRAWTLRLGDVSDGRGDVPSTTALEVTPILLDDSLILCSPFNRVFSIDARSGQERWTFDPAIDKSGDYANQLICRGVASWRDARAQASAPCAARVFTATADARLFAIDAATGVPCADFGEKGQIDLNAAAGDQLWKGEYQVTSPPVVVGDRVVVGSAVSDNARTDAPSGLVRAFDARTGALVWGWDLAPPGFEPAPGRVSKDGWALGTPNVWAPMSVDETRDLVFLPTGNAAPDYYRGPIAEMNHFGSSVVALRGSTGERVWHFATVHNDLWDYDVSAQPTLTTIRSDGRQRDVVVQATKMGLLFVLDRETGAPVFGVEERPVPQDGAAGERLSPTQPFPLKPPALVPHEITPDDVWGLTPWDRGGCEKQFESLRNDGIYTPPSLRGSIMVPGNPGGTNWGGIAVHPERQLAIVRQSHLPFIVRLFPADDYEAERAAHPGQEISPQRGTPFGMHRTLFASSLGLPCVGPPWGTIAAVDLERGEIVWQVPHGTVRDLSPIPLPITVGVPGLGGPLVTRGGTAIIAAAMDRYLRAFDLDSGEEIWSARLPAGAQATPMAYALDGHPYVVIAAGGHGRGGTKLGDYLIAFSR